MASVLWYTIPIAVAIALSVFPIVAVLILLLSPKPIPTSVPYALGWAAGLALLVAGFAIGAGLLPHESRRHFPPWAHIVEIVLGVALIVTTLIVARRRRGSPASDQLNLAGVTDRLTPARAFALGLAMNIRPKNLILTIAAGIAIGAAPIDTVAATTAVVVVVLVGGSTVVGLVVVYAIGRTRVRPMLERLRALIVSHANTVLAVLAVVVGLVLIVAGAAQLASG